MCIGSIDVSRCVIYTLMLLSVHQFCSQVRQLCRGILKFQTMRTAPRRRKTGPVGPSSPRGSRRIQRWLWILNCPQIGGRKENIHGICIYTSTLHFRGKNGSSKNIYRSNHPKNKSLYSKHVCFWENLSTTSMYTHREDFLELRKNPKIPRITRFQDLRVFAFFCGFLRVFLRVFCGVLRVFPRVV